MSEPQTVFIDRVRGALVGR